MSNWFYRFIQQVRFRWLLLIACGLTLGFASIYYCLDKNQPNNGIHLSDSRATVEWYDYIYLSVVTETTLGYGDLSPVGFSRLVACVQVVLGVLLAGVTVARLTSAVINRFSEIRHATKGVWVDIIRLPNHPAWIGVVEFVLDRESLIFRGDNYDEKGVHQHSFSCRLVYHNWPDNLVFRYHETHSKHPLQKGHTIMSFADWRGSKPYGYWVTIEDQMAMLQISGQGWKVTDKKWLKALSLPERTPQTIQEIYRHFVPRVTQPPEHLNS